MNPRPQLPVTTRLQLREMCPADIDWLDRLNSDADVMRYLGGPASRASTEQMLSGRILRYYDEHPGLGVWATVERSSGAVLGFHLLNHIRGEAYIQVGYRLFREAWGQGYATEMARALLDYGFDSLGLAQIVAITDLGNVGSQRVLIKSGLQRRGEKSFADPAYAGFGPLAWFEASAGHRPPR